MAQPNFQYLKRQKDLAKKKKQDEKRQRKLDKGKALMLKRPMENRVFPEGKDPKGRNYDDLRWSRFKNFAPAEMHQVVGEHVFPFLRTLGGDGSTYATHMKDARFTIPTAALFGSIHEHPCPAGHAE